MAPSGGIGGLSMQTVPPSPIPKRYLRHTSQHILGTTTPPKASNGRLAKFLETIVAPSKQICATRPIWNTGQAQYVLLVLWLVTPGDTSGYNTLLLGEPPGSTKCEPVSGFESALGTLEYIFQI